MNCHIGPLYIEPCNIARRSMPSHPTPALPRVPPIDRGCLTSRNILRGGFVDVVHLKTHVPNEGDIFHPILCVEDKVRNFFSLLVDIDSGGGHFGWVTSAGAASSQS